MNIRTSLLPILLLGLVRPAFAQTTSPVLAANIVELEVSDGTLQPDAYIISGGTNYSATIMPIITLTGGGNPFDPSFKTAGSATVVTSGGSVESITLGNVGADYIGAPSVTISGGSDPSPAASAGGASAEFFLHYPTQFTYPTASSTAPNEGYGAAGRTIAVYALATGTQPVSGFSFSFTANGQSIGETSSPVPAGTPAGIAWTPPEPGVYYITASTSDGDGNSVTTLPVRYFSTGTEITGPTEGGSIVPIGSSVVISATSTPQTGFIERIDFYTDWNGTTSGSTLIGSSYTYPYSVIYTPGGTSGTSHLIKAVAYDNNGNAVPESLSYLDSETLTMTTAIGPLPTCVITTPANNVGIPIPDYSTDASASIPIEVSATARPQGTITQVQLYIDGVLFGTKTTFPYDFNWSPTVVGLYYLTALATDDKNNVIASTSSTTTTQSPAPTTVSIGALPSVAITSPTAGATIYTTGAHMTVAAVSNSYDPTTDVASRMASVQFFQDGNSVGSVTIPPAPYVDPGVYTVSFTPVQKLDPTTGLAEPSTLTAIATDALGFASTSAAVTVNVATGGSASTTTTVGTPPENVTLTAPANNSSVVVNTPVTLTLNPNASAPNGNIASVSFFVDSALVGSAITSYPYSTTWTPGNLGTYTLTVQVTDNLGDKVTSTAVTVNVVTEPAPTVTMITPTSGGTVTVGTGVTVTASASATSGTISSVQFFANGISIGTVTSPPYSVSWTPASAGVYSLTSIATDNAGETTTSSPTIVEAIAASSGLGTISYFGTYQGTTISDTGRFAFIVVDGTYGTYIGYNSGTTPTATFTSDIPVSAAGAFSVSNKLTGTASGAGVSGTLSPNGEYFIGSATQTSGVEVASGYYTGSVSGQTGTQVTAILGSDGELMAYLASGSSTDVAYGSVDSTGAFTITTIKNNTFVGKANPSTGFMSGTWSGTGGGSVLAALASGGTFSDGLLKNLSTRGPVGSGTSTMIAGFVVGGTNSKQLLIRAVGPTLANYGLSDAISGTVLQVYSGTTLVASNTGWASTTANAAAVAAAEGPVGAFALPNPSADSALVGTFAPGSYTAQVTGLNSATGVALVEVYDLDTFSPFTTQKLTNVSTRGNVGTGSNVMIGGFSINGTAPKRLLIRGAGPALATYGVTGSLTAPHLQLFDVNQTLLRENFSWQTGNDSAQVAAAETATGAFAFGNQSADSAILIVLPPGTYTAELSGSSSSSGVGLVEVYEVP